MSHIMTKLTLFGLLAMGLAGCAAQAEFRSIAYQHPTPQVHVPEGHLPPPGECRVWFPDRPAGHQSPPGPCHVLQYKVPPGAHLIRG